MLYPRALCNPGEVQACGWRRCPKTGDAVSLSATAAPSPRPPPHAPELGASAQGWACSAHGESGGQNQLAIPAHPEDATLHETVTSSDQYKLAQLTGTWCHLPPRLCGESICPLAVMVQSKTKAEHTGCRNSISMKGNELTSDPNMTTLGNAKTLPCMCLLC